MEFSHGDVCIWSYVNINSLSVSIVQILKYLHFKNKILYKLSEISSMSVGTVFMKRIFREMYEGKTNLTDINPLNTKRRLLYLKTQFVPRCKHFPPRL